MGKFLKLFVLTGAVLAGLTVYLCPCLLKDPKAPKLAHHKWWGAGSEPPNAANEKIVSRPFRVEVRESVLQDLKKRLENTRLAEPLEGTAFQYGFNTNHLKTVLQYWQTKYDWRKEEARLNSFPQFLTKIEGIDVHYIHVKPAATNKARTLPLLMVHGWPGSVVEFYKIIPILTRIQEKTGTVFEIICPSIPGYGFSEAPHHPGFAATDAARVFSKLMGSLGHQKFYVQGGDWGSLIVSALSILYPEKVYGLHVNMATARHGPIDMVKYVIGAFYPSLIYDTSRQYNVYPIKDFFSNLIHEMGYMHLQATKPDTVGIALGDSPAGLAGYILEKFSSWTDMDNREKQDGGLLIKYNMDELLTNVMVYWVTNSITSSQRFYKENFSEAFRKLNLDNLPILVPSGVAILPNELIAYPRELLSSKYPQLLTCNYLERGGHFAAFEEPQLLADDIFEFVAAAEAHLKVKAEEAAEKQRKSDAKENAKKYNQKEKQKQETPQATKVKRESAEKPPVKDQPAPSQPKKEAPPQKKEVPPVKAEASPPKKEVPPVKKEVPPPKKEVPPVKKEVPPPKKEVPPVKKEVPPPKKEVPPVKNEVPPPKKEVPPTKKEDPSPKKEVPPVKEVPVQAKKEVPPQKKDVPPTGSAKDQPKQ